MYENSPLVATNWLAENLNDPSIRIVDASWRMPGAGDASLDYARRHITGAVFFDIDAISDEASPLPHMLPTSSAFSDAVGKLGISNDHHVIVYDDEGLFSAARAWWMFRAMGHKPVSVLNGGLPKWRREFRPIEATPVKHAPADYTASLQQSLIASADDIVASLSDDDTQIADARPPGRFIGVDTEPRAGLRSGHMPGAYNIPFKALLTETGELKSADIIFDILNKAGIDLNKKIITSCGSGVTAAIISLALDHIGYVAPRLYDGSWAEWGDASNDPSLFPIETGE